LLDIRERLYERTYKVVLSIIATALLMLGFFALIYLLSVGSELINSNIKNINMAQSSGKYFLLGFYDFLNIALWIFTIAAGAIISLIYVVYIIDVIRSRNKRSIEDLI